MAEMGRFARWMVNRGRARRAERLLRLLDGHLPLPASARLLELGAGGGGLSAALMARFHPGRLVVTDFDRRQVEAARTYLVRRFGNLPSTVELERVDAKELPFADRSFDAVFAIQMLHHVETSHADYRERPAVLRGIGRVLASGGVFVYYDFSRAAEIRATLGELGFIPLFHKSGWGGRDLSVYRSPS
jgi:SAM-dependent methyltransferase